MLSTGILANKERKIMVQVNLILEFIFTLKVKRYCTCQCSKGGPLSRKNNITIATLLFKITRCALHISTFNAYADLMQFFLVACEVKYLLD